MTILKAMNVSLVEPPDETHTLEGFSVRPPLPEEWPHRLDFVARELIAGAGYASLTMKGSQSQRFAGG